MSQHLTTPPPSRLDPSAWRDCVRAAVAAPSTYNTQPWLFHIRDDAVDVYADFRRRLLSIDPSGREMYISIGAAVYNLLTAVVARGYRVQTLLFPEARDPRLVARIRIIGQINAGARAERLLAAIPKRRTSRRAFHEAPPSAVLEQLAAAARAEGATLEQLDPRERDALFSLIRTAEARLHGNPEYVAEMRRWTTDSEDRRDGIPTVAFGSRSTNETIPLRDFSLARPGIDQVSEPYEPDPVVLVLTTSGDDPEHWVRAGMALERVLLEATAAGLAVGFMTQPLELPQLRELYDERWLLQATQMILRIGYADATPLVPRRDIDEVLVESLAEIPPLPAAD